MCRGQKDDDNNPLLDIESKPWSDLKGTGFKPKAIDYKGEVERRCKHMAVAPVPRPTGWLIPKLIDWLDTHPIAADKDVAFLKATVQIVKEKTVESAKAMAIEAELLGDKAWTGQAPYLRLIHCLVDDDDIKRAYLVRNDIPTGRLALDNRNSVDKRPRSVWEMLADKWNDPLFMPETEELDDLHSDFVLSQLLSFTQVENMAAATAEKCQGKLSSMIVELTRIIGNWEKSGQGDGGTLHDDTDSEQEDGDHEQTTFEFGALSGRRQGALDQRRMFFKQGQSYLLYLWHMLDKHGLRGPSFQKLDESISAGNGGKGVPSVVNVAGNSSSSSASSTPHKTKRNKKLLKDGDANDGTRLAKLAESIENLGQQVVNVAQIEANNRLEVARVAAVSQDKRELMTSISKLRAEKRQLMKELFQHQAKKNKVMIEMVEEQMADIDSETLEMNKMLDDMKTKEYI